MVVAALIVAIVSALAAIGAVVYAARLDRNAVRAATAATKMAELDMQRRHAEMTPHFAFRAEQWNQGSDTLRLVLKLTGPPELLRLDGLDVSIRDDNPWRAEAAQAADHPRKEQIAAHVWGPYRFRPGIRTGSDPASGTAGADETGRTTRTGTLHIGDELPFLLEPTREPSWSSQTQEQWLRDRGSVARLRLECRRDGWADPWILTGDIDTQMVRTGAAVVGEFP